METIMEKKQCINTIFYDGDVLYRLNDKKNDTKLKYQILNDIQH